MRVLYVTSVLATLALILAPEAFAGEQGELAPVCELTTFDGSDAVDLRQFRGKVLYVDFWASWCSPCAKAFPFLNAMDKEFRDRGLHILGVNLDDDIESAKDFLVRRPASFALASDATRQCPKDFGVTAMPSSYLVDREGRIRYVLAGFRDGETGRIREMIEELLAENPG
jgi:thiol-disulfide isomerase/thioredoxin